MLFYISFLAGTCWKVCFLPLKWMSPPMGIHPMRYVPVLIFSLIWKSYTDHLVFRLSTSMCLSFVYFVVYICQVSWCFIQLQLYCVLPTALTSDYGNKMILPWLFIHRRCTFLGNVCQKVSSVDYICRKGIFTESVSSIMYVDTPALLWCSLKRKTCNADNLMATLLCWIEFYEMAIVTFQ